VDYETLNRDEAFKVIKGEKLEGKIMMPKGPLKIMGVKSPNTEPGNISIPGSTDGGNEGPPPAGGAVARWKGL